MKKSRRQPKTINIQMESSLSEEEQQLPSPPQGGWRCKYPGCDKQANGPKQLIDHLWSHLPTYMPPPVRKDFADEASFIKARMEYSEQEIHNNGLASCYGVNAFEYRLPETLRTDNFAKFGFRCPDCQVNMPGQQQLVMHLTSESHFEQVPRHRGIYERPKLTPELLAFIKQLQPAFVEQQTSFTEEQQQGEQQPAFIEQQHDEQQPCFYEQQPAFIEQQHDEQQQAFIEQQQDEQQPSFTEEQHQDEQQPSSIEEQQQQQQDEQHVPVDVSKPPSPPIMGQCVTASYAEVTSKWHQVACNFLQQVKQYVPVLRFDMQPPAPPSNVDKDAFEEWRTKACYYNQQLWYELDFVCRLLDWCGQQQPPCYIVPEHQE